MTSPRRNQLTMSLDGINPRVFRSPRLLRDLSLKVISPRSLHDLSSVISPRDLSSKMISPRRLRDLSSVISPP
ncbi:hypothetical protein F2Q70_00031483 [Brassica cretica]|uniref:Uncharacterized protein n=1 Tax=Brassica cretica TaxID=69181 RepID=A0A8S9FJT8_BRACR|nr:hypothetical protein F2Q70_00031483 [Brassica cretica]